MRNLLASGVAALSALLLAGSAMAADMAAKPKRQQQQQQQQASNWNGGQAGGSNGASSVNNNFVEPGAYNYAGCGLGGPCTETPFSFSGHPTSYIAGLFLGYRWQMGQVVVGIEGDVNYQKGETSKVQTGVFPTGIETFTGSQKQGPDGSLRARFGVLVTPWTLLYATGGLAVGSIKGSFSYDSCQSGVCVYGASTWNDTRVGGTVGGGLETQVFQNVTVRFEYRYTDYGRFSKDVPLAVVAGGPCGPAVCGTSAHIDLKAYNHRAMVGIGFGL
ncbi:MAG: porin family protein [Hyphomicrobiales bacterium]|nr:porin family protein [Hyphomicrobiales bacterium]